jgi:predicted nicotinamide N-methyase
MRFPSWSAWLTLHQRHPSEDRYEAFMNKMVCFFILFLSETCPDGSRLASDCDMFDELDCIEPGAASARKAETMKAPDDIKLIEDYLNCGCGGVLWDAALLLNEFLQSSTAVDLQGKRVLELGSGTGIIGILLARHCSVYERVILTDLEKVCPLIKANLVANDLGEQLNNGKIVVEALDWSDTASLPPSVLAAGPLDVVLVSDCVYLESCFEILLNTLKVVIGEGTVCYMSYKKRRRAEKVFFKKLSKMFHVEEVNLNTLFVELLTIF